MGADRRRLQKGPLETKSIRGTHPGLISSFLFVSIILSGTVAPSLDALKRKFLQEESDARKLPGYVELHKTTPTSFLRMALDIEEKQ